MMNNNGGQQQNSHSADIFCFHVTLTLTFDIMQIADSLSLPICGLFPIPLLGAISHYFKAYLFVYVFLSSISLFSSFIYVYSGSVLSIFLSQSWFFSLSLSLSFPLKSSANLSFTLTKYFYLHTLSHHESK